MSTTLSKFQGTLVGAVVGDCIGAIFESLWAKTISPNKVIGAIENLETVSKEEDNHRIYKFTDDTAMARSVAKSLVINEGFDASDMAERFSENYFDEPDRGYGGNVINVFSQLKELDYKDVFGPAKKQFGGSGSYGNGGAMRIAPAALFTFKDNDPEKSKDLVTQITSITHTNNQAILGAVLQSYAVDMALNSSSSFSPDEMVDALITLMKMVEEEPKETNQSSEGPQKEDKSEQKLKTYVEKLELITELQIRIHKLGFLPTIFLYNWVIKFFYCIINSNSPLMLISNWVFHHQAPQCIGFFHQHNIEYLGNINPRFFFHLKYVSFFV